MSPRMQMDPKDYALAEADQILTPALVVYPRYVEANIDSTVRLLGGDPNRWRPHLKTVKMPWVVRCLIERGVTTFKCATTRELLMAIEAGAKDVLIAFPLSGANARRVVEIARAHPDVQVGVVVESQPHMDQWRNQPVNVFIDVNPGMDRTGIGQDRVGEIVALAQAIGEQFRGLHYYDGQVSTQDMGEREKQAHEGYDHLMAIVEELDRAGVKTSEVITSGTPAFPCAMSYPRFQAAGFVQRVSPGTVVFGDVTSLGQLPEEYGYRPAAIVVATVVSQPTPDRITCDAGHKSVSADAGVPTCGVLGRPELIPLKPSEEHLPIEVSVAQHAPAIGEALYLVPKHVCPTVNLFEEALMAEGGKITGVESIAGRGHETSRPSS